MRRDARRPIVAAGWVVLLVLFGGCGAPLQGVRYTVPVPPSLPLGRPVALWVASSLSPMEARVSDAVAQDLRAARGLAVHVVSVERLESLRRSGALGPASVVLLLQLAVRSEPWTPWANVESSDSPIGGCEDPPCRPVDVFEPLQLGVRLRGTLRVRIFDGPSATRLAATRLSAEGAAERIEVAEAMLAERLRHKLRRALVPPTREEAVRWARPRLEAARPIVSALRRRRFAEARRRAERLAERSETVPPRTALLLALAWMHDAHLPWARRERVVRRWLAVAKQRREEGDRALAEALAMADAQLRRRAHWARRAARARRVRRLHARLWRTRVPPPPPGYSETRPTVP